MSDEKKAETPEASSTLTVPDPVVSESFKPVDEARLDDVERELLELEPPAVDKHTQNDADTPPPVTYEIDPDAVEDAKDFLRSGWLGLGAIFQRATGCSKLDNDEKEKLVRASFKVIEREYPQLLSYMNPWIRLLGIVGLVFGGKLVEGPEKEGAKE